VIRDWNKLSPLARVWEALVLPLAWGLVCGILLSVSAPLYILATVGGIVGGVLGGAQHTLLREAMWRAALGGTLFGLAILGGYALSGGEDATVKLPEPAILLVLFTLIPAFPLHWLGWRTLGGPRAPAPEA